MAVAQNLKTQLNDYTSALSCARFSRDPALLERTFNRRGHANMALHRFQDAADDFTEVIRLNPKIAGYYDNRQSAYRSMGRPAQALQDANAAVRLAPTYSFVFRSRGLVYAELGRHDLALEDFSRAIGIDPNDSGLFTERGGLVHGLNVSRTRFSTFPALMNSTATTSTPSESAAL